MKNNSQSLVLYKIANHYNAHMHTNRSTVMSELGGSGWTLVWQHSYMKDLHKSIWMV